MNSNIENNIGYILYGQKYINTKGNLYIYIQLIKLII